MPRYVDVVTFSSVLLLAPFTSTVQASTTAKAVTTKESCRNVAIGETVTMEGFDSEYSLQGPVDGVLAGNDTEQAKKHCASSIPDTSADATLTLTFSLPVTIGSIEVHNRQGASRHLRGFSLTVFNGGKAIFNYTDAGDDARTRVYILPKTQIKQPATSIKVFKKPGTKKLTVCELEVFGEVVCGDGTKYGYSCEHTGDHHCIDSEQRLPYGGCLTYGCDDGYQGQYCNRTCKVGTYGHKCWEDCRAACLKSTCHHETGYCTFGCKNDEFRMPRCTEKGCPVGLYGLDCSKNCSDTCKEKKCHHANGSCTLGCIGEGEYEMPNCDLKVCSLGTYGLDCDKRCSPTCKGEQCRLIDGFCTNGCISEAFEMPTCTKRVCPVGYYGTSCFKACSNACKKKMCNILDGSCTLGCISGKFENLNCVEQVCPVRFWGPNCTNECVHTCKDRKCHSVDGSCTLGCISDFFQMPNCVTIAQQISESSSSAFGIFVSLMLFILAVAFLCGAACVLSKKKGGDSVKPTADNIQYTNGVRGEPSMAIKKENESMVKMENKIPSTANTRHTISDSDSESYDDGYDDDSDDDDEDDYDVGETSV